MIKFVFVEDKDIETGGLENEMIKWCSISATGLHPMAYRAAQSVACKSNCNFLW